MLIIESANSTRNPIIHQWNYTKLAKLVVYNLTKEKQYVDPTEQHYIILPYQAQISYKFLAYPYSKNVEHHAYGLLFEPHNTNVLVLDFDHKELKPLQFVRDLLLNDKRVETVDIAISSTNDMGAPKARHLYAGLVKPYNTLSLYSLGIDGSCSGFNSIITKRNTIIIRISEKFYKGNAVPGTKIIWEEGYSKIGDNKCLKFTQEQLIVPSITADVQFYVEQEKALGHTLQLRG